MGLARISQPEPPPFGCDLCPSCSKVKNYLGNKIHHLRPGCYPIAIRVIGNNSKAEVIAHLSLHESDCWISPKLAKRMGLQRHRHQTLGGSSSGLYKITNVSFRVPSCPEFVIRVEAKIAHQGQQMNGVQLILGSCVLGNDLCALFLSETICCLIVRSIVEKLPQCADRRLNGWINLEIPLRCQDIKTIIDASFDGIRILSFKKYTSGEKIEIPAPPNCKMGELLLGTVKYSFYDNHSNGWIVVAKIDNKNDVIYDKYKKWVTNEYMKLMF